MSDERLIDFPATDGWPLKGYIVEPATDEGNLAVILHPATGVTLHLYRKFAEFIAQQKNCPVMIYDVRGSGESAKPTDDKDKSMKMSDWILRDVPGATAFFKEKYPNRTYVGIGHSVGAHGMMATQCEQPVDVMVQIASHAGITKTISTFPERAKIWTVFNIITPITSRFMGRVPVEELGMGHQIPVGVMNQWATWTRKDDYFFGDPAFDMSERFGKATGPLLSVVFTDDLWANRRAVDILTDRLTSADVTKMDIEAGKGTANGPVGHMGFYRTKNAKLWPQILDWVDAQLN